jgi:uncharacterized protein involved in copper resistance
VIAAPSTAISETETHNMKHHVRTVASGIALLVAMLLAACGGKQTMASKSAAAFDEARKVGLPVSAGEHGGHQAAPESSDGTTPMTSMDHAQMPGMKHGSGSAPAHEMAGMDHSSMAGMDHSKMSGMQHGGGAGAPHDMAAMNHSSMAGMDHSQMSGMQQGSAALKPHDMGVMQHGTAAPPQVAAPTTNAAIARTQPAATLRQDEFDAPSPVAVDEATKAATGMTDSTGAPQPQPQPPSHEHKHDVAGEAR